MATGYITLTQAARDLHMTRATLCKRLTALGVTAERVGQFKMLAPDQVAAVKADIRQHANPITLEVAARRLSMSRVTLGKRLKTLKIESMRSGTKKILTPKQFAIIEAFDRQSHRRRRITETRKLSVK